MRIDGTGHLVMRPISVCPTYLLAVLLRNGKRNTDG